MNRYFFILIFTFGISLQGSSQRNAIWCFGDSAGMDFRTNPPSTFISGVKSRGSCASIANAQGDLLFSAFTRAGISGNTTRVIDSTNNIMQNGSNIVGGGWYKELLILPIPDDSLKYYLFSIGVTSSTIEGLFYSTIDMTQNGGNGSVIQKNVQLLSNKMNDGLIAIKHGNGRDWWIIDKQYNNANNDFYKYLITPSGILGPFVQSIGTIILAGLLKFSFNPSGSKFATIAQNGLVETFEFDRCTGLLSNHEVLIAGQPSSPYPEYNSGAFSPNGRFLYMSTQGVMSASKILQLDLLDTTPYLTMDTIDSISYPQQAGGHIILAPDNKIYWSNAYFDGASFNYPYPDSIYNVYNTYLSVINSPDSLGSACDFQPYSFYLGGARTYWGLPNNPNYELGADSGSICDSLTTGIFNNITSIAGFHVYYHSGWQIAFINAEKLTGNNYSLQVFDLSGRKVFEEGGRLSSQYFTKDLSMNDYANGMYIISLQTEKERLTRKLVKE